MQQLGNLPFVTRAESVRRNRCLRSCQALSGVLEPGYTVHHDDWLFYVVRRSGAGSGDIAGRMLSSLTAHALCCCWKHARRLVINGHRTVLCC